MTGSGSVRTPEMNDSISWRPHPLRQQDGLLASLRTERGADLERESVVRFKHVLHIIVQRRGMCAVVPHRDRAVIIGRRRFTHEEDI